MTNLSVINVEYNGAYTLGNLVHNTVIPGGSHIRAIGSVVELHPTKSKAKTTRMMGINILCVKINSSLRIGWHK